jgi:hypothetical protein
MKYIIITLCYTTGNSLYNSLKNKDNFIFRPYNHIDPLKLYNMFGKNIKVILITSSSIDIISNIKKKFNNNHWLQLHFKNYGKKYNNNINLIYNNDILGIHKLLKQYIEQSLFETLIINENDINNDILKKFININHNHNIIKNNNILSPQEKTTVINSYKSLDTMTEQYNLKIIKNNKNIKIGHIVNPFITTPDNPSYLYYAQPITFKSMEVARDYYNNIYGNDISLHAITYPEDDSIVPKSFIKKYLLLKISCIV